MQQRLIALLLAAALAGCAVVPRESLKPERIPEKIPAMADDAYIEVPMDNSILSASSDDRSDPLPDIQVGSFSTPGNAQLFTTLRTLLALADPDISLTHVAETPASAQVLQRQVAVARMKGSLRHVVDHLSRLAGFYYTYDATAKVLTISPDRQYVVHLPPINDLLDSSAQVISNLGATNVVVDRSSRTVSYRASRAVAGNVDSYLARIRSSRDLVIYETHILSVDLTDSRDLGVNWNKLANQSSGLNLNVSNAGVNVPNGINISAVFNSKQLSLNALATFLASQGTLRTLSSPLLPVISGGSAQFSTTKTIPYLSNIGSSATTVGIIQTMQTAEKQTGIDMTLTADVSDGTIFTNVELWIADQSGSVTFAALGQQINQPEISRRKVGTTIRTVPGDSILLAGIRVDSSNSTNAGLPGPGRLLSLLAQDQRSESHSELAIVIQPRRVRFVSKAPAPQPAKAEVSSSASVPSKSVVAVKPEVIETGAASVAPAAAAPVVTPPLPQSEQPAKVAGPASVEPKVLVSAPSTPVPDAPVAKEVEAAVAPVMVPPAVVVETHALSTAAPLVIEPPAELGPAERLWVLDARDKSLLSLLQRWAGDAGWKLDVSEAGNDIPISGELSHRGEFLAAVNEVMTRVLAAGAPVRTCSHEENKTLRVIARSLRCVRG